MTLHDRHGTKRDDSWEHDGALRGESRAGDLGAPAERSADVVRERVDRMRERIGGVASADVADEIHVEETQIREIQTWIPVPGYAIPWHLFRNTTGEALKLYVTLCGEDAGDGVLRMTRNGMHLLSGISMHKLDGSIKELVKRGFIHTKPAQDERGHNAGFDISFLSLHERPTAEDFADEEQEWQERKDRLLKKVANLEEEIEELQVDKVLWEHSMDDAAQRAEIDRHLEARDDRDGVELEPALDVTDSTYAVADVLDDVLDMDEDEGEAASGVLPLMSRDPNFAAGQEEVPPTDIDISQEEANAELRKLLES